MDAKQRFMTLMGQLSNNYRREMNDADIRNFQMMLKRWGMDAFEAAVHAHMFDPDGGQYFPNIANIAKHITGTSKQQAAEVDGRAMMAWAEICHKIQRIGSYGSLKMEDKQALAAVKAMGGWSNLCASNADELVWRQKEFLRLYEMFERTLVDALPLSLPGRIEMVEHKAQGAKAIGSILGRIANKAGGR